MVSRMAHVWQSDSQTSVTRHRKDRLAITPAQLTWLAGLIYKLGV